MRSRGITTSASVSWSNAIARDAISPACWSTVPVLAASSTSCCSSSRDRRASMKFVRSRNGFKIRFEVAVSSTTSGLAAADSQRSGPRDQQRVGLAHAQRQRLRHQLAQHQRQVRDHGDHDGERDRLGLRTPASRCARSAAGCGGPASSRRTAAAVVVMTVMPICTVARKRSGCARSPASASAPSALLVAKLLHARAAQRDDGDLGAREDAVRQDQGQDHDQLAEHGLPRGYSDATTSGGAARVVERKRDRGAEGSSFASTIIASCHCLLN